MRAVGVVLVALAALGIGAGAGVFGWREYERRQSDAHAQAGLEEARTNCDAMLSIADDQVDSTLAAHGYPAENSYRENDQRSVGFYSAEGLAVAGEITARQTGQAPERFRFLQTERGEISVAPALSRDARFGDAWRRITSGERLCTTYN